MAWCANRRLLIDMRGTCATRYMTGRCPMVTARFLRRAPRRSYVWPAR